MASEKVERRVRGMYEEELRTTVALIKQKSEFIEEKLIEMAADIKDFKKVFDEGELVKKKEFNDHNNQDRWLFGLLMTVIIGIFAKLFLK